MDMNYYIKSKQLILFLDFVEYFPWLYLADEFQVTKKAACANDLVHTINLCKGGDITKVINSRNPKTKGGRPESKMVAQIQR